jgi:hypothetical protein
MNTKENLRFKLDNKAHDVLNSREENFSNELKIFYEFMKSSTLLNGILLEVESVNFDLDHYLHENAGRRSIPFPDKYIDKIALCNSLMKAFANREMGCLSSLFTNMTSSRNVNDICHTISQQYFLPLYKHILEKIENNGNMLYLLDRYRHRTEWFQKERLFTMYKDNTSHGEDLLTKDLQEYLHSQGIDYPFSTPLSPSGRSDLIGLIESTDPLVLEIKLFDLNKGYGKEYIRKGLTQAYRYSLDYGKPVGYLLIFNLDEKDINFENASDEPVKSIRIGDKLIYILVVNLFGHQKSASQLKKPLPYIIEDSYLKNMNED